MDLQLKGKCAVVTGASRGIGRSSAEAVADEGGHAAIRPRNPEQVAEALPALEARGINALGTAVARIAASKRGAKSRATSRASRLAAGME